MNNWRLAQKLEASSRRGMIVGMCVAVLLIAAIVITVVKINWLKKCFGCGCGLDDFDDDYYLDADDLDESCCSYEKDFI